jgi:hypothetical protein
MPVTLAQAQMSAASDLDFYAINEFRKSSFLLDHLPFHQAVNPAGGGSTLTYGYTRQITQATAAFRAINAEYTPGEVTKAQYTVGLRPLGGSYQIDRVLADIGSARDSEVQLQMSNKIAATAALFADQVINGDSTVTVDGFDGLSKILRNSSTEVAGPSLDLTAVNTQALAIAAVGRINAWLSLMNGRPDAILGNSTAIWALAMVAQFSGQLRSSVNEFGVFVDTFRDIPLVDLGEKAGSAALVIPNQAAGTNEVQTFTASGTWTSGSYKITFQGQTTAAIAYDAAASAVVTALNLLSNIDSGDVTATGAAPLGTTPLVVTFATGGRYAGVNVPLMSIDVTSIVGADHACVVTETTPGAYSANPGGLTDLYAVRFGLDGFHGVAVPGQLVKQWPPDFTTAGAVKTGEVEMGPVAVVLKATKAAAVLRNVRVA